MILHLDRMLIDRPDPRTPAPNDAAAVQVLPGGKYGEMSTLMNDTFQSFNFRGRTKLRPFYSLIANIATEEHGHVELVSYAVCKLLTRAGTRGKDPSPPPRSPGSSKPATRTTGRPASRRPCPSRTSATRSSRTPTGTRTRAAHEAVPVQPAGLQHGRPTTAARRRSRTRSRN